MSSIKIITTLYLVGSLFTGRTQIIEPEQKLTTWSGELGGAYSAFQDVNFSNQIFNGFGFHGAIQYQRESFKSLANLKLEGAFFSFKPKTFRRSNIGDGIEARVKISGEYLYKLSNAWHVGGIITPINMILRSTNGYGNNSNYFLNNRPLMASVVYQKPISKDLTAYSQLNLTLITLIKNLSSFAYSAPQKVLEQGLFNFQDEDINNLISLKYSEFKTIGNLFNMQTSVGVKYQDRITILYKWELIRFSQVIDYPTTIGTHAIVFKYDVFENLKSKRKFKNKV